MLMKRISPKMSDNEVEEVLFLPGDTVINKKSVYEPSRPQQLKQIVCSKGRAIAVAIVMGSIILAIALVSAFARSGGGSQCQESATAPPTEASKQAPKDLIATNGKVFPWKDITLPKDNVPQSYDINMHVNLSTFTFTGTVNIIVKAVKPTDFLVLHIKNLDITNFSVKSTANDKSILCIDHLEYTKNEQFYMKLERMLLVDEEINIEMSFNAALGGSNLAGFYRSSYKTKLGETRYLATTHFEPTSARAAFPCFDEPELKANFSMSLIHDKDLISLFNTKMMTSEPYKDGLLLDKFETSVRMSTYLVAFVVCDYAHIENTTVHGTLVRVYTPPEHIGQATFALDVATNVLAYYEEYFGVPYPLKKQDLIAIPDFAAGAMENWGLITYRMTAILYDEVESSLLSRQWIAVVIAHELAHQWFGNLVTMKWWNDLWLNEGFASYVELIGSNHVQPNWKMFQQFIVNDLQAALHLDALSNSHPIMVPVHDPIEINEIFDKISYDKGSSILRMLNNFLGEKTFKIGLTAYLKKYQFCNAETKDLWDAWSEASDNTIDVNKIMDTWTAQMGYPIVTLTLSSGNVQATQERFLIYPDSKNNQHSGFESPYGYKWYLPLTYVTSKSPTNSVTVWMNKTSASFTVPTDINWIKANTDQYGYYRVNYDESIWKSITSELTTNMAVFSPEDRAGLLDDAFSFARARLLPQKVALDLTEYLVNEKEYIPWKAAWNSLGYLETRLYNSDSYDLYQKYLLKLLKQLATELGWSDTGDYLTRLLRGFIIQKAIQLNDPDVIKESTTKFSNWMNTGTGLNPNLKAAVYYGGIANGGQVEWDFCWRRYLQVQAPSEKQEMLVALSRTKSVALLNVYLRNSLDETKIRSQDTVSVIRYIAQNPIGTGIAWKFVQMNWDTLLKRYGESSFTMISLITDTTSSFQTQIDYNQVKNFFDTHATGTAKRAVKQALESIQMNIDWLQKNRKDVDDWLKRNHGPE